MKNNALLILAGLALAVPAGVAITADSKQSAKPSPAQEEDALTKAWSNLRQGARETWQKTVAAFDEITRKSQQDVVLASALPGAISGQELLGVPLENVKEGRVGSIADLVLGKDSRVDAIVVSDGGFLGIGNAQIPVKPSLIAVRREKNGKLRAITNLTETHLDEAAMSGAFMTRIEAMRGDFQKPEMKTVSRMIGANVVGANNQPVGTVTDLLLSPVGEAQYALVAVGGTMGVGAKQVALRVASLKFSRAGEPLKTTMTVDQLKALAPVRSVASAVGN